MTLLYMYFENDLPLDNTYKGINPNPKGYSFDNRFIVEFDKKKKSFYIKDNLNFVKIYNNAISNFSCIVGRNGSGKTTFLELLISNIAWGITERQPTLMKSIYYEIDEDNKTSFFLHQYVNWDNSYKIFYNNTEVEYKRNGYTTHHPTFGSNYSSKIADNTKFIFHSLSPFDKIFYSISVPFKKHPKRIPPFIEQMKYIGAQNIFKDDPKHEIQTITNLIKLFSIEYFNEPFKDTLGYEFSKISIDINFNEELNTRKYINLVDNDIESIQNSIDERLSSYTNINKYPHLVAYINCKDEEIYEFFKFLMLNLTYSINSFEDYLLCIILDNFDFNKIESNILNFNNFLNLISFSSIVKNNSINFSLLKSNILKVDNYKDYIFINDLTFLTEIEESKELIEEVLSLGSKTIQEISSSKNLSDLLYIIRKLKNKNYLEFEVSLLKNKQEVNYFYLSSGEKTMISYFANLANAIMDFGDIKNKSFIIIIDEVELHLHPKWQINFVEYMNTFFRTSKQNMMFQFIIATHSPFVLSDIPEEQIIFINENDKKENQFNTFGANIYDIFEKGFFLDNSIGKRSENFIKKISDEFHYFKALEYATRDDFFLLRSYKELVYNDYKNKKEEDLKLLIEEIKYVKEYIDEYNYIIIKDNKLKLSKNIKKAINIIGEPTIKNHLLSIYNDLKEISIDAN
ncbi:AAA family ATPase [Poseidonibacter lekithochrous]|uniref:AAA family ATPase n=1 Tax=Poseidonibacter lekithochrous TaxID=1904463 RepID=UPI000D3CE7B1|nr:AAA family ATPase [Poseidonibacter lekithochrous]